MRRHRAIGTTKGGFTLVELLVVIAILALLVSLILVASADGVRRAEERATQSLITKLETAVNDRLDALLNTQPPTNQTHRFLAAINWPQSYGTKTAYQPLMNNSDDRRAQTIAQYDYIRAELPDVFFVNGLTSDGSSAAAAAYPLNFAASPYPSGTNTLSSGNQTNGAANDGGSWVLPLGNNYPGLPGFYSSGLLNLSITTPQLPATGMFGASFSAAASVYKNLYSAAASDLVAANPGCLVNFEPGLDGIDNNGDGLVDELVSPTASNAEVVVTGSPSQPFASYVSARLVKHTHKTARAEVLYALLVNGLSPLGSAFSSEDFTSREVQDTDGDGMPEFVDAWGEPIQFFRWPIYYGTASGQFPLGTSDSQLGSAPIWRRAQPDPRARPARREPTARLTGLVVEPGEPFALAAQCFRDQFQSAELLREPCDEPVEPRRDRVHELFPFAGQPLSRLDRGRLGPGEQVHSSSVFQQGPHPLRRTRSRARRRAVLQGLFAPG